MAKRTSRRKAGNTVNVDFEGVDVRVLLPEGMYEATVDEVKMEDNNGKPYLSWKFKTIDDDPKFDGKALYNNTSLQPQSLWVLATLLDCLGVERPDGPMDLDLESMVDMEIMLQVEHEEYEGKTRAKVVDFMAAGEADEGEEVEVEDDGDGDGGGGEGYTEAEIMEMDADELAEVVEENELKVRKVKKLATMRTKVLEALTEAGLITDDAEEEGEEGEEGDGEGYTEEEINEMDADELAEVIEENDLKVRKVKKLATMRAKVITALEEAGLIGESEDDADEDEGEEGEEGDLYTESEVMEMSAAELDALNKEEELEVDKPKRATKGVGLKKYREAIVEALEEAELLDEEDDD